MLVGHSLGGIFVRHFARRFPDDVAGLVLVDSSHRAQMRRLPPEVRRTYQRAERLSVLLANGAVSRLFRPLQARALRKQFGAPLARVDGAMEVLLAQMALPGLSRTARAETACLKDVPPIAEPPLPARPLVVLVVGEAREPMLTPREQAAVRAVWLELQNELAALSPRSTLEVVEGSSHNMFLERPDAVIAAIRSVVDQARASA